MRLSFCRLRRLHEALAALTRSQPSRRLVSLPFPRRREPLAEEEGGHGGGGVGERLVQNIIRAGLRELKRERLALEKNVREREVDVDLQKLVHT